MSSTPDAEPLRLGVLISGSGTNLQAILDACTAGSIDASVGIVLSNRRTAGGLARAERHGVPTAVVSHRRYERREDFDAAMVELLRQHEVDLVVLAGFMRLVTPVLLNAFRDRVLNIHPSLLPAFPGIDGQRQAFDYGVRIAGCSVHLVDTGMDSGPIVVQAAVPGRQDDDPDRLQRRILAQEHRILPLAIQLLAEGRVLRLDGSRRLRVTGLSERPSHKISALLRGSGDAPALISFG